MPKGPSDTRPLLLALCAAVVLLGALSLWLYVSGQQPEEGSAEAGFVRDMSVHHAQAVEMAEIVRDKTRSGEIRILTSDIALTQQGQIGRMQGWLALWNLSPTGPEPAMAWMGHPTEGRMPGMASPGEIEELQSVPPEEADRLFLRLMIPHHEAAVPMARAAVERSEDPDVVSLAGGMIAHQQSEVRIMTDLLAERGVEAPQGSHAHGHSH